MLVAKKAKGQKSNQSTALVMGDYYPHGIR